MNIIWYGIAGLFVLLVVFLGVDFTRFIVARTKTDEPMGVKCAAGGILFVHGNRTYYNMPNGVRRKIADYAMDLTPGSRDMNMFSAIMDQAAKEKINEGRVERKKSKEAMESVAKEIANA